MDLRNSINHRTYIHTRKTTLQHMMVKLLKRERERTLFFLKSQKKKVYYYSKEP